jgi:DNA-binding NarL/FixJ family response regulator
MSQRISVLLVDHHVVVRRGIRRVLEDDCSFTIVGEADNGVHAIHLASRLHPRIAIIECGLPKADGFLVTRAMAEPCPKTSVVLLGTNSGTQWIRRAKEAGAHGFVPKQSSDLELVSTVRRVAAGELVFLDAGSTAGEARSTRPLPKLTPRELQIIRLIVEGHSTKAIASQLRLSAHTVATHRARIGRSVGVRKTAELVAYAIRHDLIDDFPS